MIIECSVGAQTVLDGKISRIYFSESICSSRGGLLLLFTKEYLKEFYFISWRE